MALIAVTRLRVRSWTYLPQFVLQSFRCARQAERASGFLGGKLLRETGNVFWTLTVWEDATSMNAYRTTGVHRSVMPKLLLWCDEASVVHWNQPTGELPSWLEAHRRMAREGRLSKVRYPSPAQAAVDEIPVPQPGRVERTLRPVHPGPGISGTAKS